MKKYLKIFVISAFLTTSLMGCNNQSNKQEEKPKQTKENKEEPKKEQKLVHNLVDAKELAKDISIVSLNNFDLKPKNHPRILPSGFLVSENTKKEKKNNIHTLTLKNLVDKYNEYNKNTYNEKDVYNDIKSVFSKPDKITYEELDEKSTDYSKSKLDKEVTPEKVIYFKKDKTFVYNLKQLPSSDNLPVMKKQEDWIIKKNEIIIPYKVDDKDSDITLTLKLNDKKYKGGEKNSTYYVYDIKNY